MRSKLPAQVEKGRIREGPMASDASFGMTGAFMIQGPSGRKLTIISSGVDKKYCWEHVTVSSEMRIPNWEEMCFVKNLFWDEEECVMQLHPPKSRYVNCFPYCLHLWRPLKAKIPQPDPSLVGPL